MRIDSTRFSIIAVRLHVVFIVNFIILVKWLYNKQFVGDSTLFVENSIHTQVVEINAKSYVYDIIFIYMTIS